MAVIIPVWSNIDSLINGQPPEKLRQSAQYHTNKQLGIPDKPERTAFPVPQPAYFRVDHLPILNMTIPAQTNFSWVAANYIAGHRANDAQYDLRLGNFDSSSTARDPGFPQWDRRPHLSPLSNWGNRISLPRGGRS